MRDCSNGEIRDLLPDLVHDGLDADTRARVSAHVGGCADCTAEVALLTRIRTAAQSGRLPAVNVERIVSALPRARRRSQSWSRNIGVGIAAALVALVAGATWISQSRGGRPVAGTMESPAVVAQAPAVQGGDSVGAASSKPASNAVRATKVASASRVSLDDGLADLSDSELRSLLAALDSFEAVTAVEPSALEPILESERLR